MLNFTDGHLELLKASLARILRTLRILRSKGRARLPAIRFPGATSLFDSTSITRMDLPGEALVTQQSFACGGARGIFVAVVAGCVYKEEAGNLCDCRRMARARRRRNCKPLQTQSTNSAAGIILLLSTSQTGTSQSCPRTSFWRT
jgi:hypothetical protein